MNTAPEAQATDVSVVLHTRNRARDLADVLERLGSQTTRGAFTYDVLVVDNGSSDDTARCIDERIGGFPVPLRRAFEPRVGRPHALNTGVALAGAPILAFTDDDTLPDASWLDTLRACLIEERADAVAGRVLPLWLGTRPPWLTDEARRAIGRLGCLDHGADRLRSAEGYPCRWFTSNLALRREPLRQLGGWDESLRYYQDTDLHRRALAAGWRIVYEPAAVVHHKIRGDRLTLEYFRGRRRRGAVYLAREAGWKRRHLLTIMPLRLHLAPWRAAAGWLVCTLRRDAWWRRFERELQLREALRVWWTRLRMWPRWLGQLARRSSTP